MKKKLRIESYAEKNIRSRCVVSRRRWDAGLVGISCAEFSRRSVAEHGDDERRRKRTRRKMNIPISFFRGEPPGIPETVVGHFLNRGPFVCMETIRLPT